MHMHTHTHTKPKRARNFQKSLAAILKLFLNENDKTEATLKIGFDETKLFHFNNNFCFQSGKAPKWLLKLFCQFFLPQILPKLSWIFSELSRLVLQVLACMHARCLVMGITGVGQRPTPDPPQGLGFFGA